MFNTRRRAPGYGVILLAYQVFEVIGIKNIPPITLAITALHTAIYLRLFELPWYKASQVCASVYHVWYRKEYKRLIYAAFEHGDDWHLYYNMVSFLLKGKTLERRFGSAKFLYLNLIFTILTNMVLIGLNIFASEYFDVEFGQHCAIGFSGVIFAHKVLTSYYEPNRSYNIMGLPIPIPANYIVWVELIVIQLIAPNVSFLGHLAGILVGLAYIKSPLGFIFNSIYSFIKNIVTPSQPRFRPQAAPSGYAQPQFASYSSRTTDDDEQLQQAINASLQDQRGHYYGADADDIRRRRLEHYQ